MIGLFLFSFLFLSRGAERGRRSHPFFLTFSPSCIFNSFFPRRAADVGSKVADKADAAVDNAKDKAAAVVSGRRLMSFIDLNPNGRRLLQDGPNCGICEYSDRSGACKVAPASLTCDGIVGMSGEWNCGTCEFYTNNDFLGYCETVPGC